MKRILVLLLALTMVMALFVGCQKDTTTDVTDDTTDVTDDATDTGDADTGDADTGDADTGDSDTVERVLANDTETLNLDWWAGIGTATKFEQPYRDLQSLYPFMLFNTLIKMDPYDISNPASAKMELAKSITVSEDGLEYVIEMNDAAVWSDGEPVTAEDVAFSFNLQYRIVQTIYKPLLTGVEGAQDVIDGKVDAASGITVDGNVVTIKLTRAFGDMYGKVFACMQILPKHLLGETNPLEWEDYLEYWTKPVGSGPWMIDTVSFPDYFTMVKNPLWWGEPVNIENINFTSHAAGGVEATFSSLSAGEIDYAFGNAVNNAEKAANAAANNPNLEVLLRPSAYQRFFTFNQTTSQDGTQNDFLKDVNVRRAIALAIDRDALAEIYGGNTMQTCVAYDSPWYNTNIPKWERDVEEARRLLTEAGYYDESGKAKAPIRLSFYYDDPTTRDAMDYVAANLAELGITVSPFLMVGNLGDRIYDIRNWDIMFAAYNVEPAMYAYDLLLPTKTTTKYLGNADKINAEFVPLFEQFTSEADFAKRKEIADQIQQWDYDNCYYIHAYGLDRITIVNTAKLEFDQQIFKAAEASGFDWMWSTWNLYK